MIKIAICDDDKVILDYVYNRVKLICDELTTEAHIEGFLQGDKFLSQQEDGINSFDILFLDIDMPLVTGFDIAKLIRKSDEKTIIIFLTSRDELVYESFKYRPFRFIRKQKLDEELSEVLASAINSIQKSIVHKYNFNTDLGEVILFVEDILYIECINRKVYLKTEEREYYVKGSQFNQVVSEFLDKNFILIHRTCLVNLKYIFSIGKIDITLDNGTMLPMSRYKTKDVKRAFLLYAE